MSEKNWIEDEEVPDAEVIKLEIGDSIEGILIDKFHSTKYDVECYKIKVKDDDLPKILVGTTILERKMKNKQISEEVKIERVDDLPSDKGKPLQNYLTFHKDQPEEKTESEPASAEEKTEEEGDSGFVSPGDPNASEGQSVFDSQP